MNHSYRKPLCGLVLFVAGLAPQAALADDPYDPPYDFNRSWTPELGTPASKISPLCGDVYEVQPAGWSLGDDCPTSQWGVADRIVSTYGPRLQKDGNDENFDFHRGVDFRTVEMEADNDANGGAPDHTTPIANPRPVFAVAAGTLVDWDLDATEGYLVIVEHRDLGLYTRYKHLSSVAPILGKSPGDSIDAGEYLGLTGRSQSGNHHLHFEVRKVTADGDATHVDEQLEATWMRNAVHPLRFVPYDPSATTTTVTVTRDADDAPTVEVETGRFDLRRVFLSTCVWSSATATCNFPFVVPGNVPIDGYYVNPPFVDFELANYEYTHRGPSWWWTFQADAPDECPYAGDPETGHTDLDDYDGDRHLAEEDTTEHTFNGVTTEVFGSSTSYHRIFHFDAAPQWESGCAVATVTFVDGSFVQEDVCW
jgi:murein DD-endopeptidase MepM/ murein hydrolase activator NlpD